MAVETKLVDTKLVMNRRSLHYESLGEFLVDAQCLAQGTTQTLGNWTLAQIFDHVSRSLRVAVEGTDAWFPWPARCVLRFARRKIMSRPMKPGFHVPRNLEQVLRPGEGLTADESLQNLHEAICRFQSASQLARHPAFGKLTRDEWQQLTLRHAELHMSFVIPDEACS